MSTPDEETPDELEARRHTATHAVISFAAAIGILGIVTVVILVLATTRPVAEKSDTDRLVPPVQVMTVETRSKAVSISTQGVVESRREVRIAAEISGTVTYVSPNLLRGALVADGEVLVRIRDEDYQAAKAMARSQVTDAELNLELEIARSEQAVRDWEKLASGKPQPELSRRKPQLASADARLESANAELARADRNVDRTVIEAPFKARVRQKSVETGGYLAPGGLVAELYSPDQLEVRLPLSLEDFGFLKRADDGSIAGDVTLRGTVGITEYTWTGEVVRIDGEVDRKTLSATAIIEIDANTEPGHPPHLEYPPVGLFVRATVPGRKLEGVTELPRMALRDSDTVIVVDDENLARNRKVTVLRRGRESVWISEGLRSGEKVVLKGVRGVTENGLSVHIAEGSDSPAVETQAEEGGS